MKFLYYLYFLAIFFFSGLTKPLLTEKIWRIVEKKPRIRTKDFPLYKDYLPFSGYHMVPNNNIPWFLGLSSFCFFLTVVNYFQKETSGLLVVFWLLHIVGGIWNWGNYVIWESLCGCHSKKVKNGLRIGFSLFIVSEVMFFFSFFWAYFHFSLSPSIWVGAQWPYSGLQKINYLGIPLMNTVLLVVSGFFVNHCQNALIMAKHRESFLFLIFSIAYGILFLDLQHYEYNHLEFSIASGVFGSIFFLLTGFHGFHVIVGVLLLLNCTWRYCYPRLFLKDSHLGLEVAIYYWHFVDVVWLLLYAIVYVWK